MKKLHLVGATALVLAALALHFHGQPTVAEKWEFIANVYEPQLKNREVQIEPAELQSLMQNDAVNLVMLDVREESCYNIFHLQDAKLTTLSDLPLFDSNSLPDNSVIVTLSNDERDATEAWKILKVIHVANAYILEGGINHWLDVYGHDDHHQFCTPDLQGLGTEVLRHKFQAALGDRQLAAHPESHHTEERTFEPKVKLSTQGKKSGGCG